jgi:hypothetical protein
MLRTAPVTAVILRAREYTTSITKSVFLGVFVSLGISGIVVLKFLLTSQKTRVIESVQGNQSWGGGGGLLFFDHRHRIRNMGVSSI